MSAPDRTIASLAASLAAWLALGFYWLVFLGQPLQESEQGTLSRASLLLSTLVYPEGVITTWFDGGRLPLGFVDRWPIALGTATWLLLATAIGWPWPVRLCLTGGPSGQRRNQTLSTRLERLAWSSLIGLAGLSTLTLVFGLCGGLSSRTTWLLLLATATGLNFFLARWLNQERRAEADRAQLVRNPASATKEPKPSTTTTSRATNGPFDRALSMAMIGLTIWLGIVIVLGAWVPASEFDVVEYHLQAPKEFYQSGSIGFVPHNIYANMPLGIEMHTLAAMVLVDQRDAWLGGLIGKSISASISLIGAVLLGTWMTRRWGSYAGWSAAGIWLSSHGIAHVAVLGLIDGALATYVLAAALATWQAMDASKMSRAAGGLDASSESTDTVADSAMAAGWWCLAGTFSGMAAASKYPGLVFAVMPCLALLAFLAAGPLKFLMRQQTRQSPHGLRNGQLRYVLCCGLGLLVTCVPWYIKSAVLTGNPVYPLAASIFGGRTLTAEKIQQWQQAHQVPLSAPSDAPISTRITSTAGRLASDAQRVTLTSTFVQPTMILGLAVALVCLVQRRRFQWPTDLGWWLIVGWSAWILIIWWTATHRIDRFWLPVTGLWSALAGWGLFHLRSQSPWLAHTLLIMGLGYGAIINSAPLTDNRYFVSLAALRDDVGDEEHPPRISRMQAWINQNLDTAGNKLLLVGEARVFEYRVPILYSTCFDINPGEELLAGRSTEEQRQALRAAGVTHLAVNWNEIQRYRSPGNYGFSQWPQREDIQQLVASGVISPVAWDIGQEQAELFQVE
ncbi:MAG: hypothetical protein IT423_17425 [Pirellulaceae bacterium]|nr:hypothetical protein [Pirellulaceae bacterium]